MSEFFTFRQTVLKTNGDVIKPLFDPLLDFNIEHRYFRNRYVHRFYTKLKHVFDSKIPLKLRLEFLGNKLLLRDASISKLFVEVTILQAPETKEYIELMRSKENVELIETPIKYKF